VPLILQSSFETAESHRDDGVFIMNLRLQRLLLKLGEIKKSSPPTRHEVSQASSIDIGTMTRIFSIPQTRLRLEESEKLVAYLFSQFRPLIVPEVTDEQLWNQLRFELFDFDPAQAKKAESACLYNPDGKYNLKDIGS
jgi:hypothetical protein